MSSAAHREHEAVCSGKFRKPIPRVGATFSGRTTAFHLHLFSMYPFVTVTYVRSYFGSTGYFSYFFSTLIKHMVVTI